jgi:putative PIN family toxin of toxin-antitoxin system
MRTVADTNIVVSGLLWQGPPRRVLDLARIGGIELFTSPVLLTELEEVLSRGKFARKFKAAGIDPWEAVLDYAGLAQVVLPVAIRPAIPEDPDDDAVLACALGARAEVIVSGDRHLLGLKEYQGIRIVRASDLLMK